MWQPLGSVAPGSRLIAKRCLGFPARPATFCGTEAVARWQAASARTPLMGKPSPLLRAVWHRLCFSLEDRRGRSGVLRHLRRHPSPAVFTHAARGAAVPASVAPEHGLDRPRRMGNGRVKTAFLCRLQHKIHDSTRANLGNAFKRCCRIKEEQDMRDGKQSNATLISIRKKVCLTFLSVRSRRLAEPASSAPQPPCGGRQSPRSRGDSPVASAAVRRCRSPSVGSYVDRGGSAHAD